MSDIAKRHVFSCRHMGFEKRLYLVWAGDGDGKKQLEDAVNIFAKKFYDAEDSPEIYFTKIASHLKSSGFQSIKA